MHPNMNALQQDYQRIESLYDMADMLVDTTTEQVVIDKDAHVDMLEPLANQLSESCDILCEEFIEVAGKDDKNAKRSSRIESAMRKLYMAIDHCSYHAAQMHQSVQDMIMPVIAQIKRHVEAVVAIFVGLIDFSLDRIMQKQHIDELRDHQEKVASFLHQAEQRTRFNLGT